MTDWCGEASIPDFETRRPLNHVYEFESRLLHPNLVEPSALQRSLPTP
jgi:hypothetical protein